MSHILNIFRPNYPSLRNIIADLLVNNICHGYISHRGLACLKNSWTIYRESHLFLYLSGPLFLFFLNKIMAFQLVIDFFYYLCCQDCFHLAYIHYQSIVSRDGPFLMYFWIRVVFTLVIHFGCPRGVMVKAMNCGIVVREFVLQVALLRSLSGKYPWERYEPPYSPSNYG